MAKRNYKYVLLTGIMLLFLLGCASQGSPAEERIAEPEPSPTAETTERGKGGTLRMMYWDAPTTLNPHLTTSVKDTQVSRIIYEPLASFDKEGQLIPFLAAEIPSIENGAVAEDGKSVTWKLKQDIFWSDGKPFTAEDVLFTYQFTTNPDVNATTALSYEAVDNVEIIDDYTIRVNFTDKTPTWAEPFVGGNGLILPKHKFETYNGANAADAPANSVEPVGTGPYRVMPPGIKPQEILFLGTQLVQTNKIVFEPNPYFREEDKPYFSKIELKGGGTAKEAARLTLQGGDVDYAWNLSISPDELEELETDGVGQVFTSFGSTVDQIELNFTDPDKETEDGERSSLQFPHPAFSDLKVRQAFAHAIDRPSILELYGLSGEPTEHILVSPPQYKSDRTFYEFDLDKASALLDEAGWVDSDGDGFRDKDGKKLSVLFQTFEDELHQQTQRIVQKDLKSIQVDADIDFTPISIFYSDMSNPGHNGRFLADMQESDWTAVSPDPGLFLQYWTCEQIPQKENGYSGFNFRRWCSPEYDDLYEQSKTELDPDKRGELLVEMNDMLSEEVVTIPVVRFARISAVNLALEGLDPTPWDSETWNIKDWRKAE